MGTWHNLGFVAAQMLATELGTEFVKIGNAMLATQGNIIIAKPLTYMNRSGEAIIPLKRKNKIATERIIVLVDDIYTNLGKIKIVRGGTSGHNGTRNIKEHLGSNEYLRIKIGCKPAREIADMALFVLSKVPKSDELVVENALKTAVEATIMLINGATLDQVCAKFNTKTVREEVKT